MSEQKIVAAVNDVLNDDKRANALDFIEYLKALGVSFEGADQYWTALKDGQCVCSLWISGADEMPGPWDDLV